MVGRKNCGKGGLETGRAKFYGNQESTGSQEEKMEEKEIGEITHYFGHIDVGIIEISAGGLSLGDRISIRGHTTGFEQAIESMQIEHEEVDKAGKGDVIGIKVKEKVRPHDKVYKIIE